MVLAQDLQQEARIAVYDRAHAEPTCPDRYLVHEAKIAILRYRKRGSSVDGKLNPNQRRYHYETIPILHSPEEGSDISEEVLSDTTPGYRSTEREACTNVLVDECRERLSNEENTALDYRLADESSWDKIAEELDQRPGEMYQTRRNLEQATVEVWELSQPYIARAEKQKRKKRLEQLDELFRSRPAGELVSYDELLPLFAKARRPDFALWNAIYRYSKELKGERLEMLRGKGYALVEAVYPRDPDASPHRINRTPPLPEQIPNYVLEVLSEEQRAVLEGYRQSLTHKEIARLIGRSRPTVTRTIARIWKLCNSPPTDTPSHKREASHRRNPARTASSQPH